jgi:hypothetical protein
MFEGREPYKCERRNNAMQEAYREATKADRSEADRRNQKRSALPPVDMLIQWKEGDIVQANEQYIVHQTSCVAKKATGLASRIFQRFPHAECYAQRSNASTPGTIEIRGNGANKKYVANMHALYREGRPTTMERDTVSQRLQYFWMCLKQLAAHLMRCARKAVTIAFTNDIGYGPVKGDEWYGYRKQIIMFATEMLPEHYVSARVVVYSSRRRSSS